MQLVRGALGPHFSTLLLRDNTRTGKTHRMIDLPGKAARAQELRKYIQSLKEQGTSDLTMPLCEGGVPEDTWEDIEDWDISMDNNPPELGLLEFTSVEATSAAALDLQFSNGSEDIDIMEQSDNTAQPKRNRQFDSEQLNSSWQYILPSLRNPLLAFMDRTAGCYPPAADVPWLTSCTEACFPQQIRVLCLKWDRKSSRNVLTLIKL